MRFHMGVSFSWKQIKRIILPILIGIALYFGFNMNVYAEDTKVDFTYAGQQFYMSACIRNDTSSTCTNYGSQGYNTIPFDGYYFLEPADATYNAIYQFQQINIDTSGYSVKPNTFYKLIVTFETGDMLSVDNESWKNVTCGVRLDNEWNTEQISSCFGTFENNVYTAYVRSNIAADGIALFIGNNAKISDSLLYYNAQDAYQQGARASNVEIYITDDNSALLENIDSSINNSTDNIINNNNENTDKITGFIDKVNDTVNQAFKECRLSNNLFNYKDTVSVSSGITVDDEGWITVTYDNTNGTDTSFRNYFTNNLDLKTNTEYSIIAEIKSLSGNGSLQLYSANYSGTQGQFILKEGTSIPFSDLRSNSTKIVIQKSKTSFENVVYGLRSYVTFKPGESGSITFRLSVLEDTSITASKFKYEPYGEEICSNKLDNVSGSIDDLENTITDSNIDDSTASGFFGDFKENDFGLSDIVKAPLILIQDLTNGSSCQTLNFNVLGADVSMPSGCILWDKVPDEIETIYYVFIGGFLAYILGTKLFHDVNDLKDPNKNEVSTLDL